MSSAIADIAASMDDTIERSKAVQADENRILQ
jgi:hypothetical protein